MRGPFLQTFQQPLTKREEEFYLARLQEDDENKRNEAKQILIERNLRLVAHIAKKYQGAEVEMEDLISIGTVGLIKAIMSFDKDKKSKLGTYAARCIENVILSPMCFWHKKITFFTERKYVGGYFLSSRIKIILCVE